ncbi:copper transporter [Actinomyces sp. B33]|uniref:copper transporter n=1 Tax=Actinomyces sp. B33 TaxID=2942131 RepID=UPI002341718D|nr:copper transporter [Actinomyces sp. B33]MDC4233392.1 copper transporter [Actinomyces sp. B33]
MINFRYHLVSLIAVFAALAVGIVLGAGPLQTRLASTMNPQTDSQALVESQAVSAAEARTAVEAAGLEQLADSVLPGTLAGTTVATVALPGADAQDVERVRRMLTTAGASLVGAASLTDNWDSQAMAQYRQTLSTPLATHMAGIVPADATADAVIGHALVQVLTSTGSETDLLREIITDESTPILSIEEDPAGGAQAIVLIGGASSETGTDAAQSAGSGRVVEAWAGAARAVGQAPGGGVVIADASGPSSMLAQVRALGVPVTSVDSPSSVLGALGVALALPGAGQQARAFGTGEGATAALPDWR